jgi:hypothetical protein
MCTATVDRLPLIRAGGLHRPLSAASLLSSMGTSSYVQDKPVLLSEKL